MGVESQTLPGNHLDCIADSERLKSVIRVWDSCKPDIDPSERYCAVDRRQPAKRSNGGGHRKGLSQYNSSRTWLVNWGGKKTGRLSERGVDDRPIRRIFAAKTPAPT